MNNNDEINVQRVTRTTIPQGSEDSGGQEWPTPVTNTPDQNLYEFEYYRRLEAEQQARALEATVTALGKELLDVEETYMAEIEAANTAAEVAEELHNQELQNKKDELDEVYALLDKFADDNERLNDSIDEAYQTIKQGEDELSKVTRDLRSLENEYGDIIEELYQEQAKVEDLEAQLARAEPLGPMIVRETAPQPRIVVKQPTRLQRATAKLAKFRLPKLRKQARISVLDNDPIR